MHQELLKQITQKISQLYNAGIDHVIAPPFCAYCKQFLTKRTIFCIECYAMIQPIVSVHVQITKTHRMTVMALSDYQEPLKTLLLAKAWGDIIACKQLGQLIWQMTYFKHMPCDYLVPIPLHWIRFAKRGYNQAEEIAQELAVARTVSVATIVSRTQNTPFQSSLAHDKRLGNVKNAFTLATNDAAKYENKHIVLVDDLMTTGATLAAAAKVLLPLKPASINAIVACRVI